MLIGRCKEVPVSPRATLTALLALGLVAACGGAPEDPAAQVDEIRSGYTAALNTFAVHQVPEAAGETAGEAPEAAEDAPEAADDAAAVDAPEEGEEAMAVPEEVPVRQDVILDILLSREGRESLPGITVDIEHVGPKPEMEVKETYRAWLDTSDVHRGAGTQVVHRLEDVDYVEGDGFHVEVRHPIPPGERGEYREFQEAGEGQP